MSGALRVKDLLHLLLPAGQSFATEYISPHPYLLKDIVQVRELPKIFPEFYKEILSVAQMQGPPSIIRYVKEQQSIDHLSSSSQFEPNV